jgi:hypothetical protein
MQPAAPADLIRAVAEICTRCSVDAVIAQDLLVDAHELGDITLRFRRPDGSFGVVDRNLRAMLLNPWGSPDEWRQIFDLGEILVPRARPRGAGPRVMPADRCRIFLAQSELDELIGGPVSPVAATPMPKLRGEKPDDITPLAWAVVQVLDSIEHADSMQRKPLLKMVQERMPNVKMRTLDAALAWRRKHPRKD